MKCQQQRGLCGSGPSAGSSAGRPAAPLGSPPPQPLAFRLGTQNGTGVGPPGLGTGCQRLWVRVTQRSTGRDRHSSAPNPLDSPPAAPQSRAGTAALDSLCGQAVPLGREQSRSSASGWARARGMEHGAWRPFPGRPLWASHQLRLSRDSLTGKKGVTKSI